MFVGFRLRLEGVELPDADLDGARTNRRGFHHRNQGSADAAARPADANAKRFLERPIESDAPEIVAEAERAVGTATRTRDKAERLTRYVNALLDKKPTVSLPSALEVLRTKVGDCNEHTALYVAMARAAGIPRASPSGWCTCAALKARSTTMRGLRCIWRRVLAEDCGCPSIRRSTSFPPTEPTCGLFAVAWTSRRRFFLIGPSADGPRHGARSAVHARARRRCGDGSRRCLQLRRPNLPR